VLELLWLIPTLPLASSVLLMIGGRRFHKPMIPFVGAGSVGLSALITLGLAWHFFTTPPAGHVFSQTLWIWMNVDGFSPAIGFSLDAISLIFILVVTCIGFLIHLYSAEFMEEDESYARFFAYMNLFVASMLILVLADNLLLLYLGWEGVGVCSFLLIGFWYKDRKNCAAARKAFIVTRIGDTAMAIGLFLLVREFNTLHIRDILAQAPAIWTVGAPVAVWASALLLFGAIGKSGQLPLQTWLPDAMAGPTPVSALIHAATMVTAGVYLIARMHGLFLLAPTVQSAVAVIGTVTLLIAGFSALTQRDLKRALAYSTISQIGYMFLALGVGAWSIAIFHFMTHAFFKALLFLASGVVINAVHHEHDIFKMGGLRKELPTTFWTFTIGAAALAGFPLVTAGFYSKDAILWFAWLSPTGGTLIWALALFGAFLTAIYSFRLVFRIFFGEMKTEVSHRPGHRMTAPLIVLAILAIIGGFVELPHTLGHVSLFSQFLETALPKLPDPGEVASAEIYLQCIAIIVSLSGIAVAYFTVLHRPVWSTALAKSYVGRLFHSLWYHGWGFDWVYEQLFVTPFTWVARINRGDFVDLVYVSIAGVTRFSHSMLRLSQNGRVRWYAAGVAVGSVFILGLVVGK